MMAIGGALLILNLMYFMLRERSLISNHQSKITKTHILCRASVLLHRQERIAVVSEKGKSMGALMSRMWFMLFPAKEYKIVVVGLDNAGKTTTLYKLHLGEVVTTHPTVGSNVEEVVYKNIRFEVWDLGGQDRLRTSWATYYRGTHAVIVVIDSTDRARISTMKDELFKLLPNEDLQSAVVLVFANKQDLKDAMTPAEITDALSLHSIKNHDWHIQACCALTGEGLYDGLGWIAQRVAGKATS
ncbi:ADP-ribosylation factor-like protein 5 [Sesamum alatum]|uniref:ADP-ribosylation factor-like protein 5 n=1 Tax=Sesamum alatum TaxID=300844 RepID=A0AAE1YQG1_9LAMI|nr:ADP-ribosylation factor-like protein 5 [Sesamum alatum]